MIFFSWNHFHENFRDINFTKKKHQSAVLWVLCVWPFSHLMILMLCGTVIRLSRIWNLVLNTSNKFYLSIFAKYYISQNMLKIKLYVILSILLFHLFDESCAIGNRQRGSGSKSNRRRTNNCPSVSSRGPPSKIDCKYLFFFFFCKKKYVLKRITWFLSSEIRSLYVWLNVLFNFLCAIQKRFFTFFNYFILLYFSS